MFSDQGLPYRDEVFVHLLIFTGLLFWEFVYFPLRIMQTLNPDSFPLATSSRHLRPATMNHHFLLLVLSLALQASLDVPVPVQEEAENSQSTPTLFLPLLILRIIFVHNHLFSRLKCPTVLSSESFCIEFLLYL